MHSAACRRLPLHRAAAHARPCQFGAARRNMAIASAMIQKSDEVAQALHDGKAVVALESTIISHGAKRVQNAGASQPAAHNAFLRQRRAQECHTPKMLRLPWNLRALLGRVAVCLQQWPSWTAKCVQAWLQRSWNAWASSAEQYRSAAGGTLRQLLRKGSVVLRQWLARWWWRPVLAFECLPLAAWAACTEVWKTRWTSPRTSWSSEERVWPLCVRVSSPSWTFPARWRCWRHRE